MARRSSARLRARQSATPQPQKVINEPLQAVVEHDEMPGAFPGAFPTSASPEPCTTPTKLAKHIEQAITSLRVPADTDSKTRTPSRPSYPDLSHFGKDDVDMASPDTLPPKVPQTCPPKASERQAPAITVQTPGRIAASKSLADPPAFQFTFRAQSLELSNEARQMMAEKREEAARIKRDLDQASSSTSDQSSLSGRKLATAKTRAGRFSDVHSASFKKMDSIAEHVTRVPTKPPQLRHTPSTGNLKRTKSKADLGTPVAGSLKRTKSKADLASPSTTKSKTASTPVSKSSFATSSRFVPSSAPPMFTRHVPSEVEQCSPAKRVKRSVDNDVAALQSIGNAPGTPRQQSAAPSRHFVVGTPSMASSRQPPSVKSAYASGIPTLSPTKMATVTTPKAAPAGLSQSPTRPPQSGHKTPIAFAGSFLNQSPIRPARTPALETDTPEAEAKIPLLARSPVRRPQAPQSVETASAGQLDKTSLLSRSPVRPPSHALHTPSRAGTVNRLTERFNQLRSSPVKSILRTPKRNYSNNPVKIANGTHLATPESDGNDQIKYPMTEPVRKHVDFTASTKFEDGHAFKKSVAPVDIKKIAQNTFTYPKLPTITDDEQTVMPASTLVMKKGRRKTFGADEVREFTFRSGNEISFSPRNEVRYSTIPPSLQDQGSVKGRKQSIRQVSVDADGKNPGDDGRLSPESRKRKFVEDQENAAPCDAMPVMAQQSEREENDRPVKRSRPNGPVVVAPHKPSSLAAKRASTARAGAKPNTISQARLNALAMPKRR